MRYYGATFAGYFLEVRHEDIADMGTRTLLYALYYAGLLTAAVALIFLLFALGHTETASLGFMLLTAGIAGAGALVAGVLQWVGLPAAEKENARKGRGKGRGRR